MSLKRFRVDKLIRDRLPEIMRSKGIGVHERELGEEEFFLRLKNKLIEEATEVQQASNPVELVEELGDVLEVVLTIAKSAGIKMEDIEQARLQKRNLKGGFDKKIYNKFVEIEENNPNIKYYLDKSDQYPCMVGPPCS